MWIVLRDADFARRQRADGSFDHGGSFSEAFGTPTIMVRQHFLHVVGLAAFYFFSRLIRIAYIVSGLPLLLSVYAADLVLLPHVGHMVGGSAPVVSSWGRFASTRRACKLIVLVLILRLILTHHQRMMRFLREC